MRLRREHAPFVFDHGDLALFLQERLYEQHHYYWFELFKGTIYGVKRDKLVDDVVQEVLKIFNAALGSDRSPYVVTDERRFIRIDEHNLLYPRIVVHQPGTDWEIPARDVVMVVDVVTGVNENRILSGRRLYRKHGIHHHWLIDLRRSFVEVAGLDPLADPRDVAGLGPGLPKADLREYDDLEPPAPEPSRKQPIAYRFEADQAAPIAVNGVKYGELKLQDVFTP